MKNINFLSSWVKRFLLEYLISVRNLSQNTQKSYRDTFRLFLPFIAKRLKKSVDQLTLEDLSPEDIKIFLSDLESMRSCSVATRNQRLATLHSFAQFVGLSSPEHVELCRQIRSIPFKKAKRTLITYLEKSEMDAFLNAPNCKTKQGKRDYAILLFLYNTGARANELAQLTIGDLDIAHNSKTDLSIVTIKGKGNKLRRCPLWKKTVAELAPLIFGRAQNEPVFLNRCFQPLTRFGVHALVNRYAKKLILKIPALKKKNVSPHIIRHTTATHLLRAGVDINTIRAWLGHVSINTTNIYAEVDIEMKERALACCEPQEQKATKRWQDNKGLMDFLESL